MHRSIKFLSIIILSFFIYNCAGSKPARTSGSKPKWTIEETATKRGKFYFKSVVFNGNDLDYMKRNQANAGAIQTILEKIQTSARLELDNSLVGTLGGAKGKFGSTVVNALSQAKFSSLTLEESYWETVGKSTDTYDWYGWYSVETKEIKAARERAWQTAEEQSLSTMDEDARNVALEAKSRFLKD